MNRRHFLTLTAAGAAAATQAAEAPATGTRGVVLYPFDLSLADWPERAAKAGVNTIALHAARRFDVLQQFIEGTKGQAFLEQCRRLNLTVEYELHAMSELLSRELYYQDPTLFRMDEHGVRNADANCNPLSPTALDLMAENAVRWAKIFAPTSQRFFYWPDDGARWCQAALAEGYNASDQALLVENHLLRALRQHVSPQATLSHLCYQPTLIPPSRVRPEPGIFLEFAPIARDYRHALNETETKSKTVPSDQSEPATNGGYLELLKQNLALFGTEHAQALEYWLDVSMFSKWSRPAVRLPWNADVCRADLATYRELGIRNVTTFATYLDADYVQRHGDFQSALNEYGAAFPKP